MLQVLARTPQGVELGTVTDGTIVFGVYENSPFILALGILCGIFDLAYVGLLIWAKRQPARLNETAPQTQAATA